MIVLASVLDKHVAQQALSDPVETLLTLAFQPNTSPLPPAKHAACGCLLRVPPPLSFEERGGGKEGGGVRWQYERGLGDI